MDSSVKTEKLRISGMTCVNCENIIKRKLRSAAGIEKAEVSYSAGTASVTYDADIIPLKSIVNLIEALDYHVLADNERQGSDIKQVAGILIIIVSLYVLLERLGLLNMLVPSQLADTGMGYGMLFVIGLITSVHCIAMCGGINLSQSIPRGDMPAETQSRLSIFIQSFLYNFGRVVSYTAVGFVLGFAGLLFGGGSDAGLPIIAQGILKLIAGVFMVIMGINMLGLFPWLRKLQPRMPKIFASKGGAEKARSRGPLFVGLLNGFMPCGPLQSIQILALASGNPITGAVSMFLFSLGTVPLMLGLGSVVSALGKKFTQKVMTIGAVLVVVLGLAMLSQGGSLSGFLSPTMLLSITIILCAAGVVSSYPFRKQSHRIASTFAALGVAALVLMTQNPISAMIGLGTGGSAGDSDVRIVDGRQIVSSVLSPWSYPAITVQAGMPVEWIIDAPDGSINGCNNRILIREYGIEYTFQPGENVIEFMPVTTGRFQYACWMGMIRSTISVVEEGAEISAGGSDSNDFSSGEPIPADVAIPTDTLAIAEITEDGGLTYQTVTINLTDEGFSPAVAVAQAGIDMELIIHNTSNQGENYSLLIPAYYTVVLLDYAENPLYLTPGSSFDFSNGDNTFYGYVMVVDDLEIIETDEIKLEAANFLTMIWPPETFRFEIEVGANGAALPSE